MPKRILYIGLTFLLVSRMQAQAVFEFNSTCQQAFQEITRLKVNSGSRLVQKARQQNPRNLIPELLDNYIDFYTLFLNEDPEGIKRAKGEMEKRLIKIKSGPKSSPFYLYAQGMIYLQRAAVLIKAGEIWDAAWDCRRSYQLLKENKKNFPTFAPNDLPYGTLQAVTGTIPKGYRWIAGILGMRGSVSDGMQTVRSFINSSDPWSKVFFQEAAFVYPYLLFYLENKKEEALLFTRQQQLDLSGNHLHLFMTANLAINHQQAALAAGLIQKKQESPDYLTTHVWDFQLGFAQLYRLQTTDARQHFETFLQNFKGKYYVKDVYQKLSWCYWLEDNVAKAEEMRKMVISRGATFSDADKKAMADAQSGKWPDKWLLKARLLSDGGYHTEALSILNNTPVDGLSTAANQLEYHYRMARVYDALGKSTEALKFYAQSIKLGKNRPEYFAARAALQSGQIYENQGNKQLAMEFYRQCINMNQHEYKNSLDQRAKAGIARCMGE
ncbi:MAG: tetratricopeptide repeat protein [Sediminibacterium sp.]